MISGGLHDDDRPPVEAQIEAETHAKWRERGFWASLMVLLWAAFQGMAIIAFWFLFVVLMVVTVKVVAGPMMSEIRKTWRG